MNRFSKAFKPLVKIGYMLFNSILSICGLLLGAFGVVVSINSLPIFPTAAGFMAISIAGWGITYITSLQIINTAKSFL